MNAKSAIALVRRFEDGSLPKGEWTHTAHFVMASWYCLHFPLPEAVQRIREGIRRYNESVGGKNTDESGYHETVTLFFVITISRFIIVTGVDSWDDEALERLLEQDFCKKDYVCRYYAADVLADKEARLRWVEPEGATI